VKSEELARLRFETRAVHAGLEPDPSYGSVIPPIHQTSTYAQRVPGEFVEEYDYARSANPTRAALERALGELEGGLASAFASGMAATHALLTAATDAGAHVVLPNDLYGGTYRLVDKVLTRFGLSYDLVDQTDPDAVAAAMRPETRVVWVETPTNPLLNVVDIRAIADRSGGALLVVDNTFATPAVQRPLELGAGAVVHSTTKYLGGHSDVVGGAIVGNDPRLRERLAFIQNAAGGVPGAFDAWLVLRGAKTLGVRMERHARNAAAIAKWLKADRRVARVYYPGLPSHPQHALARRLLGRLQGAMLSFDLRGGALAVERFMARTRLLAFAPSFGDLTTTWTYPARTSHRRVPEEEQAAMGIGPGLIRVSVGLEDPDDLMADLAEALG
jgi:cystathionine gamma-synthase